ncbi:RNA pyrophosphohydrolase [Candidatus Ruthia endofausta]|uniref:RNA pyrophosphohydrolase n=1 Tax=Candidatus Ruthia endofausta TaxID=2738852 RepID=A0A6N0HMW1_9GAMM|nr:RNA pyrophosphohydrolase [Candidatus Ruthia endofausta]QKQ23673.1 RNA pyrophosphohydrolase [Candidatus Ruthia endofausta]
MIDSEGYQINTGIVIIDNKQQILLVKCFKQDSWQLPQSGIDFGESEFDALFQELNEEIDFSSEHLNVLAKTLKWLRYDLPDYHIKHKQKSVCIAQKQVWFLLRLISDENNIKLDIHTQIEFDDWAWVDYWRPIENMIDFKKPIYEDMLKALTSVFFNNQHKILRLF